MVTDNSSKEVKQISQIDKEALLKSLESASNTRRKVRRNIKNNTLPNIPEKLNKFLDEGVA